MRMEDHLREELILINVGGSDTEEVIRELSARISLSVEQLNADEVAAALLEREAVQSTSLGGGVAIPHATIEGLQEPVLAIGLTDTPMAFGPPEEGLVELFFVLLSPPGFEGEHIKLLARICRLARQDRFIESLRSVDQPAELMERISKVDRERV